MILEWFKDGVHLAVVYLLLNLISFSLYAIDKRKAIKHKWRISENVLLAASVLGIIGAFCGMIIMHHKTKKPKFYIGLPVIFILEAAAAGWYLFGLS